MASQIEVIRTKVHLTYKHSNLLTEEWSTVNNTGDEPVQEINLEISGNFSQA